MSSGYSQTILPVYNKPYVGGLCEGYVECTVGQASLPFKDKNGNWTTTGVFPTAAAAWKAHPDHPGELPPPGISVAVHFSLGNNPAGHVAVILQDGRVASSSLSGYHESPFIYANIDSLVKDYARYNGGCRYLGWSEWIGNLKIIGESMEKVSLDIARLLAYYNGRDGRDGRQNALSGQSDDDLKKNHVGKELTNGYIYGWWSSAEGQKYASDLNNVYAERDNLRKENADLKKQIEAGSGQYEEVTVYRKVS